MKKVLVLAFLVLTAAGVYAADVPCANTAALMPTTGCYDGDKWFSNFAYTPGLLSGGGSQLGNLLFWTSSAGGGTLHEATFEPAFFQGGVWQADAWYTGTLGTISYTVSMYAPANPPAGWGIIEGQLTGNVTVDPIISITKTFNGTNGITWTGGAPVSADLGTTSVNISMTGTIGAGTLLTNLQDTYSQGFIPEPATMALFGSGLLALGLIRRFRR